MTVDNIRPATITPNVLEYLDREARPMIDEAGHYLPVGHEFAADGVVRLESFEYVMGGIHTNTIEGYFSIFKHGMNSVYQHFAKRHRHPYLPGFDLIRSERQARGVNDSARTEKVLATVVGKRLTYRPDHRFA